MTDPIPFKVDASLERKQLAEGAHNLLDDKAFTAATLALRKQFFEQMMMANSTEDKLAFIERIRALETIPKQLQIFINDERMAQARKK